MSRLFGTDGVRGVANKSLTPELAFNLGKAGAHVLSKNKGKPVFLIGEDTRISADMFQSALSAGILAVGGNVIHVGVLPTPAIAYLVRYFEADAGVVISASHNTFEYNGIKFFNGEGLKLDDEIEDEIEDIIVRDIDVNSHITGEKIGRFIEAEEDATELYAKFLTGTTDVDLSGKKIVLDCANGAAYKVAKMVYDRLGAETVVIGNEPTGTNINEACGSTHPEKLQETVIREKAFMGMAFDGDADRLIAIDELGRVIDGDKVVCICAEMLHNEDQLVGNKVTGTIMSNIGVHKFVESMGCSTDVTGVGDRCVLEKMLQTGCVIGGEQSGHIIFLNHTTTGDGILSSLQLLRAIMLLGCKPSEAADRIEMYPQVLRNATVKEENKPKCEKDEEIQKAIKGAKDKLADSGRVLIRPSGTEPCVRVMIEGKDIEEIDKLAENIADLISEKLG